MKNELSALEYAARFLEPWNGHDVVAVLASLPEDFEWQFTAGPYPNGIVYRGRQELRDALEKLFAAVPDIHYQVVDVHEGPDHLAMELLVTGNNRETGAKLNFQAVDIVLFEGGRLHSKRSYRKVVA